jgi:hypothetical protein
MRPEPFPRKPLPTAPPEKEKKKDEEETKPEAEVH